MSNKKLKRFLVLAASPWGQIEPPSWADRYGGGEAEGIFILLNSLLKFLIGAAGIYALFNLILAGYGFISAGDNPEKVSAAFAKIWQSIVGLAVVVGSFAIAGVVGQVLFGDPGALLNLEFYGPNN